MFVKINETVFVNLDHVFKIRIVNEDYIKLFYTNGDEDLVKINSKEFEAKIKSQIMNPCSIPIKSLFSDK